MAITLDHSGEMRRPNAGRPKKMKKSWTMKGVLRINSTYAPTTQRSGAEPAVRPQAQAMPSSRPTTADTAVSPSVQAAPLSSMGHSISTAEKSSSMAMACFLGC